MRALLLFLAFAPLGAQAAGDDVSALRREVEALRQEVQEIKQFLAAGARPQQRGWERVENAVLGLDDAPQRGDARAPLVLVEFSDYQCPYCGMHAREVMPSLEREYVASGKLRYVISEFPLIQIHPLAAPAAVAARCAGEQSRFWEMHARLFEHQRELAPVEGHAKAIGLDAAAFDACVNSGKYVALIEHNAQMAQKGGVRATPTFVLGYAEGNRVRVVRRLQGSAPFPVFKSEIDALLAQAAVR
jgi:protein-disulfide isomerase